MLLEYLRVEYVSHVSQVERTSFMDCDQCSNTGSYIQKGTSCLNFNALYLVIFLITLFLLLCFVSEIQWGSGALTGGLET